MSIVHIEHRSHWTGIANAMLEDHRLSFKARGLLAYLLTKPEGWETQTTQLCHASDHDGRSAIYSALEELTTYGYATYEQPRQAGRFVKGGWTIRETPQDGFSVAKNKNTNGTLAMNGSSQAGFPFTENPLTENPLTENRDLSKDLKKQDSPHNPPQGKTRRMAKRAPADFALTDELRTWAMHNAPSVNLERETAIFLDHEFAHARTDWSATWRNWIRKAAERFPRIQQSQPLQRERLPL